MKRKLTFVDLFAGCGGLSEGFMASGDFDGLAHVEWEKPMVNTLRNRLFQQWGHSEDEAKIRVIHFDIQKTEELLDGNWSAESLNLYGKSNHSDIPGSGIRGIIEGREVDLVIGGPPCQAYSMAGRAQDKNGMKDDYRNYLFESFIKVVKELNAKLFVFENVPGMLSAYPGGEAVTERIHKAFESAGYEIRPPELLKKCIYQATKFGVPQDRSRVIIIGVKKDLGISPEEMYEQLDQWLSNHKPDEKDLTVESAIGGLASFKPLENTMVAGKKRNSHEMVGNPRKLDVHHQPRYHNIRDIQIFKDWVGQGWNHKKLVEKQEFYHKRTGKQSNHNKYRSLEWKKPSPTIVAHLNKDGLLFIHPDAEQARTITVREAALLQSFPPNYNFIGEQGVCYKMIGNAVPPMMAQGIASALALVMERSGI
jgi:DNA (cytosine-5)-methyltransferase 1